MTMTLPLADGGTIPALGFGLWRVPEPQRVIASALEIGYRLIDGAFIYENEAGMGAAVREAALKRDALFVTTKVWNEDQGFEPTRRAVAGSLERTGLDYFDLVLIHWPCAAKGLYVESWRALRALRDEGVIRHIGVSNFNAAELDRLKAETGEMPVLNQVELHPGFPQAALRAAHAARGVITQSWSPLARGQMMENPGLKAIAARHGKTPAQIILRWHLELGLSVIPRSNRREGLAENFALFDFVLRPEDHAALALLDNGTRTGPDPAVFS